MKDAIPSNYKIHKEMSYETYCKQYGIILLVVFTAILHLAAAFDKVSFQNLQIRCLF